MIHEPKNTYAGQVHGRPLNMLRYIGDMTCAQTADHIEAFMATQATLINPQSAAIEYYLLEHAVGKIRTLVGPHDDLGPYQPILETYNRRCSALALRAYFYLLMICSRESRHASNPSGVASKIVSQVPGVTESDVANVKAFVDTDTQDVKTVTNVLRTSYNHVELGPFCRMLYHVFTTAKFGPAYGGHKWAVVTDCLAQFVEGKTSASMMLDTVWTLSHNTAPIFNKLLVFEYQDTGVLLETLDIQRSGQIPNLVSATNNCLSEKYVTPTLRGLCSTLAEVLGAPFDGSTPIDWNLVESLGAVGSYSKYKTKTGAKKKSPPKPTSTLFPGFAVEKADRNAK